MGRYSVITLTTAPAGEGKTYVRCGRFMVDQFLVESNGRHISNFPIGEVPADHSFPPQYEGERFVDRIAEAVAKKRKCEKEEVLDRIESIPDHVLKDWREGRSGPWEWFANQDISGCHIAIDEIHNYCGKRSHKDTKKKWQEWLGEIRHQGATVEFISQVESKIATEIVDEAGTRYQIYKKDKERDPFFGIELGDWYELRAKYLTGKYTPCVVEKEFRDQMGKWKESNVRRWWMTPDYFRFFDSHAKPQTGQGSGSKEELKQYQKRGYVGLLLWFIFRNFGTLFVRLSLVALVAYVTTGGGTVIMKGFLTWTKSIVAANHKSGSGAMKPVASETVSNMAEQRTITRAENGNPQIASKLVMEDRQKVQELERELSDGVAVALITDTEVTFRDGLTYSIGDRIELGPYKGKKVVSINWKHRSVRLDDETVLRMGSVIKSADDFATAVDRMSSNGKPQATIPRRPVSAGGNVPTALRGTSSAVGTPPVIQ